MSMWVTTMSLGITTMSLGVTAMSQGVTSLTVYCMFWIIHFAKKCRPYTSKDRIYLQYKTLLVSCDLHLLNKCRQGDESCLKMLKYRMLMLMNILLTKVCMEYLSINPVRASNEGLIESRIRHFLGRHNCKGE